MVRRKHIELDVFRTVGSLSPCLVGGRRRRRSLKKTEEEEGGRYLIMSTLLLLLLLLHQLLYVLLLLLQMPLLMGVPGMDDNLDAMLEDDSGLEAELAALVGGGGGFLLLWPLLFLLLLLSLQFHLLLVPFSPAPIIPGIQEEQDEEGKSPPRRWT